MNNRIFFITLTVVVVAVTVAALGFKTGRSDQIVHTNSAGVEHELVAYRSPTCGCCVNWVSYMKARGYKVESVDVADADLDGIKEKYGVPGDLYACHTTVVNGGEYFIEGLVPEEAISRLLEEQPDIRGIGLPGMPAGSPGMPGSKEGPFDIMMFDKFKKLELFERI